jgi:hypothetical protein
MNADWFGAWGAWVGGAATLCAAAVALWIAANNNSQERQQRRVQTEATRQAVIRSLLHAHSLMAMVYEGNDQKPNATLATRGLKAVLQSALADIAYALSQPFVDPELLDQALQFQSELTMLERDLAEIPQGAKFFTVADAVKLLEPFRDDLVRARAALEEML